MKKPLPEWAFGIRDRELKKFVALTRRFCADCGLNEDSVGRIVFKLVCAAGPDDKPAHHKRAGLLNAVELICELTLILCPAPRFTSEDMKIRI